MKAIRSPEQARREDERLLTNFLRFLDRAGVEMSAIFTRADEEGKFMRNLTPKEQRNLAKLYLTKKRK